jgi:hypothetical protein
MAGTTGLEPATSAVTGQRSNQLSYVPQVLRRIPYCITLIPRGLGKHRYDWAGPNLNAPQSIVNAMPNSMPPHVSDFERENI